MDLVYLIDGLIDFFAKNMATHDIVKQWDDCFYFILGGPCCRWRLVVETLTILTIIYHLLQLRIELIEELFIMILGGFQYMHKFDFGCMRKTFWALTPNLTPKGLPTTPLTNINGGCTLQ